MMLARWHLAMPAELSEVLAFGLAALRLLDQAAQTESACQDAQHTAPADMSQAQPNHQVVDDVGSLAGNALVGFLLDGSGELARFLQQLGRNARWAAIQEG